MTIDRAATDKLLTTTRSVRKRLDQLNAEQSLARRSA